MLPLLCFEFWVYGFGCVGLVLDFGLCEMFGFDICQSSGGIWYFRGFALPRLFVCWLVICFDLIVGVGNCLGGLCVC